MELHIEVKRMMTFENEGNVKALCDVDVNEQFLIRNLRIVDGKNGLFVSMPRLQTKRGQWIDLVSPLKPEIKEQINASLLAYYEENRASKEEAEGYAAEDAVV
jgi:stage V sporulation protein G